MAGKVSALVEMSLRDVEPVKGFIDDMITLRNRVKELSIQSEFDSAFRKLYNGFADTEMVRDIEAKDKRGWRIDRKDVPLPTKRDLQGETWPSVCIVIPVFNAPALLKRCLVSLMKTDYKGKLYFTCVDNASDDQETLDILAGMDFQGVRFDEPVGFAKAVNAGIKACPGFDYYVLFNQDCRITDEQWLQYLINWMELREQCAIAGPKLLYPDGTVQHAGMTIPRGSCGKHRYLKASPDLPDINYYEKVQSVTGAVYAIKASLFNQIGYLDENYLFGCEDTEFCLRAACTGNEVWYVPESVVVHVDNGVRKAEGRTSGSRIREWAERSDKWFRKDWGSFVDLCDGGEVAFVLPDWNPVAGGCRVVGALANVFVNAGLKSTIYLTNGKMLGEDADFPMLFDIKPIADLEKCDILIATRYDTVSATRKIKAARKLYFVQADERPMAKYCGGTVGDVESSFAHMEYEIISIGEHLREMISGYGRTCQVFDVGLYRDLYRARFDKPVYENEHPYKVLLYASPADYKGGEDVPLIAQAIRNLIPGVEINSFHRDFAQPPWSDNHFRPGSTSEVAEVYASHDVYVYASLSDGFAMTPVEAMACGTPVVLTDFPGKDQYTTVHESFKKGFDFDGNKIVIVPGAMIVPFRDIEAVAQAVSKLCNDYTLKQELSREGCIVANAYDWSKVGLQYLRAIAGVPTWK